MAGNSTPKMGATVRFTVNGQVCNIGAREIPATLSLARYLRETLHLTGTKISCNQAGCGACTVAVFNGTLVRGGEDYKSLNSCITPLL